MSTLQEANIINTERHRAAASMTEQLQKMGVDVRIQHFTGDSSFPTEYTIDFHGIRDTGPTFEMTLMGWLAKLIEYCRLFVRVEADQAMGLHDLLMVTGGIEEEPQEELARQAEYELRVSQTFPSAFSNLDAYEEWKEQID